ncbi:bifunctional 3-(3-hydroxy-phenyl)propionate/3-hydroxycinnamic acid hydroxylase [Diaphorobacter sp. HDW4A]|uniref:bifunctional 3-(3-hydroxy-phenyl)propionate/3-hydroxycinnamic acid hydroxylase n=1 Tax=Diaphorobacter sp. HDW4A TaxID=2714924 RepID=UPI001407242A|nr:bifunctional 3-(3-hydroxy-phenyl)propionate/3-hydroxycinnamic acid hydroxylase [Diaphorobacter sp. HDW4A]QIL79426.1 bifunctional 3-(3-hydroxy-phenyl)propionate/3-hydroxycinnamic acid hydroxylase [Diaphorobacter sp. HDW4A]
MFDWDVIVVGAGPTGLTMGHLLGKMGIRTLIVERNKETVAQPRAVSIDDEALRTMQAAGVLKEVLADVALDYGLASFDAAGRQLQTVHPTTREYGFPRRNAFVQPLLEAALNKSLANKACVSIMFNTKCVGITENAEQVDVHVVDVDGSEQTLRSRYVIGADGASSFVRQSIGATLEGATFDQRWLIIDLENTKDRFRESKGYFDPARPAVNLPGPDGRRRFEFMLHAHEKDADFLDEKAIRQLLSRYGPDQDAVIVRKQVYGFHARVADRWQTRRIFLCGDAAHLSPPFAGQGVNSAFRDVHNISWKIAAVVRGEMGPALLSSYQVEREPHARALIDMAVKNGKHFMVKPGLHARLANLGTRLAMMIPSVAEHYAQMKNKPKGSYTQGFLTGLAHSERVGRLAPQPMLETLDRALHPMDDLTGVGFAILVIGIDAQEAAAKLAAVNWMLPGVRVLAIVPGNYNLHRTIWTQWAGRDINDAFGADEKTRVLLLRPDRYVALDALYADDPEPIARTVRALVESTFKG